MLFLDYNNGKFEFGFDLKNHSFDDFKEIKDDFSRRYFTYNRETYRWELEKKQIEEILLHLNNNDIDIIYSDRAIEGLEEVQTLYVSTLKLFRGKKIDKSILREGVKLYDFQEKGVNWRIKRNNYLDADDAGLGKTVQNILVFSTCYNNGEVDGIIIVCPSGLGYHWKREILKFVTVFKDEEIYVIDNDDKVRPFDKFTDKKILIIPTHLFPDCVASYRKAYKRGKSLKKIRWNQIPLDIKEKWGKRGLYIIVDESHSIKRSSANVTKACMAFKDQFDYVALLSATPAINRVEDFYTQVHMIDKSVIPMSEGAFRLWIADEMHGLKDIISYNEDNVEILRENLKSIMIKRLKEDVPEMKVKRIMKEIYVTLHPYQKKLYEIIVQEEIFKLVSEYDIVTWKLVFNKFDILCRILDNPLLLIGKYDNAEINHILSKWKLDIDPKFMALKSLIYKYLDLDEKVIIYDIHPETLDTLADYFQDYSPLVIHGSQGNKDKEKIRQDKIDLFNNDPAHKLFFLSALTSSAGLNLQKMCRRIIVYTMTFDATLFRQLIDRTNRIDSKKDSIVEILYYPETIDNIRVNRVLKRWNFNDKLNKEISKDELRNLLRGII